MANEALDDVDAAVLEFGKEFNFFDQTVEILTNDEMMYVLSDAKATDLANDLPISDIFKLTHDYCEKVATTTTDKKALQEIAETIPALLGELELEQKDNRGIKKPLHPFEKAALTNLVTATDTTPQEVVHWIPSLSRFDDDEIQKAIDIVAEAKAAVAENN
jgi:hypothetical protein